MLIFRCSMWSVRWLRTSYGKQNWCSMTPSSKSESFDARAAESPLRQWLHWKVSTSTPLPETELNAAFEWTCRYGPANCWAGTTAEGAQIIRRMLLEIERLKRG